MPRPEITIKPFDHPYPYDVYVVMVNDLMVRLFDCRNAAKDFAQKLADALGYTNDFEEVR